MFPQYQKKGNLDLCLIVYLRLSPLKFYTKAFSVEKSKKHTAKPGIPVLYIGFPAGPLTVVKTLIFDFLCTLKSSLDFVCTLNSSAVAAAPLPLHRCRCAVVALSWSLCLCRCAVVAVPLSLFRCRCTVVTVPLSLPRCCCPVVTSPLLLRRCRCAFDAAPLSQYRYR